MTYIVKELKKDKWHLSERGFHAEIEKMQHLKDFTFEFKISYANYPYLRNLYIDGISELTYLSQVIEKVLIFAREGVNNEVLMAE